MTRLAAAGLCAMMAGCATQVGPSVFEVSGEVFFTGQVDAPVQLALFHTGDRMADVRPAVPFDEDHELVSSVEGLGSVSGQAAPFALEVDLSAFEEEGSTATLLLWSDVDGDGLPTAGEPRSRVVPDLVTGCPVFGPPSFLLPAHFVFGRGVTPGGSGWHRSFGDDYVVADDAQGATLESESDFTR